MWCTIAGEGDVTKSTLELDVLVRGMSSRICVDLYNAIIKLRPDWASSKDDDIEAEKKQACVVKIVMTGSADDGPDCRTPATSSAAATWRHASRVAMTSSAS